MRQAVRVQQALAGAVALGATLTELLDSTGIGIIQLNARGRIVHANDPAMHLLRTADAVLDEKGILFARTPHDNADLQRLLARALPEPGPPRERSAREGGSMLLNREGTRKLLSDISEFLDDLHTLHPMHGVEERNTLRNRQKILAWLEDALGSLCETLADIEDRSELAGLRTTICESVDGVLLALVDAMESDDPMAWELASGLTGDRAERQ